VTLRVVAVDDPARGSRSTPGEIRPSALGSRSASGP